MSTSLLITILLSAGITALMRTVPLILLSRFRMAPVVQNWLGFIPSAIMAAIITSELVHKPLLSPSGLSMSLMAAALATVCGIVTRSLFVTVIAGMVGILVLKYLLGA
ncbi:branched-subunit amino acid transport protein [Enterobacter sp. BIGb0383]|uniref:AzlD domain-containing protein n=1 Tax=unclassified Enterobacter TaxID=2608935 RepID=UPI000F47E951|nr:MULTISPECIES: AzlD domain-containing protein [unclassified Enterobacter]ROP50079.1 branched-subunit amino acid transport protein [Enterobacter sp. BIGb0383]ROS06178.1 branched-subunit amino acid transport protein [Enterobacter sp. BIGb0359]